MIDWFVLLTPLLVIPIVLLLGFIGCTLETSALSPVPLVGTVRFRVQFPRLLSPEAVMFHVFIDITRHTEDGGEEITPLTGHGSADDEEQTYQWDLQLEYGDYTVYCFVDGFDAEGRPMGDLHVVDSIPCTLTVESEETQVRFEADVGSIQFSVFGCETE